MGRLMRPLGAMLLSVLTLTMGAATCRPMSEPRGENIRTSWTVSNGVTTEDGVLFLSHYKLFVPGRTIIPLFATTRPKIYSKSVTLYRYEDRAGGALRKLWRREFQEEQPQLSVQTARGGYRDGTVDFVYQSGWDADEGALRYRRLTYNAATGEVREADSPGPGEPTPEMHDRMWMEVGRLVYNDFERWHLPCPLEFTSTGTSFLTNLIDRHQGDEYLRLAALRKLDSREEAGALRELLASLVAKQDEYPGNWLALSRLEEWAARVAMTDTLQRAAPPSVHRAAYRGDIPRLEQYLRDGADRADPDSRDHQPYYADRDELGLTPLLYALIGGQPEALSLLAEAGADPEQTTANGTPPWFVASRLPLRRLYLDIWDR